MIRNRFKAFSLWLGALLIIIGLSKGNYSSGLLLVLFTWLCLPFLSWIYNYLYGQKEISLDLLMPITASKEEKVGIVVLNKTNSLFLPLSIYLKLEIANKLTGERSQSWTYLSGLDRGAESELVSFKSSHCGYLEARIAEALMMDWFGFLAVRKKLDLLAKGSILPDSFLINLDLNLAMIEDSSSEDWSQNKKGNDLSSVFELRDYRPGDSLKQIHWKLSSKRNELIVKEGSLPTQKSLLLFWDKNSGDSSPQEIDLAAEVLTSLAQALEAQGRDYVLAWTQGHRLMAEEVKAGDRLPSLIPRVIKVGPAKDQDLVFESETRLGKFGKIIYLAKEEPVNLVFKDFGHLTYILAEKNTSNRWRTINYGLHSFEEDLQWIEV